MRPIVLLDCDGVLAQTPKAIVSLINNHFGTSHKLEDVKSHEVFASLGLLDKRHIWFKEVEHNKFCYNLEPFPEAIDAVIELQKFCDVFCLTAPFNQSPWMHEREMWLCDNFNIHRDRVVQTASKFLIFGHVFVDDFYKNVEAWKSQWYNQANSAIIFDSPYAQQTKFSDVPITNDWQKIIQTAEKYV